MVSFRSDDLGIERRLRTIRDLVEDAGGILHPGVELRCESGELGVACTLPYEPRTVLTAIPEACMLPVDTVGLRVAGDALAIDAGADGLSATRHRLYDAMLEIYQRAGKVPELRASSVWCGLAHDLGALKDVVAGRPDTPFVQTFLEYAESGEHEALLLQSFLKSRVFYAGRGDRRRRVLVPVNDFIDHHPFAPGFRRTGDADASRATVHAWRESAENDVCFVSYTQMDAYDSLLLYNYVDEIAPVVRSVPLRLQIGDAGCLRVGARITTGFDGPLAPEYADLRAYVPKVLAHDKDGLEITHLFIPVGFKPRALHRVLTMLLSAMPESPRDAALERAVREAEAQVIALNLAFYRELERRLVARRLGAAAPGALDRALAMARLQIRKLGAYDFG
jgi:hypothetical protein